jgi:hypothetical protein
MEKREKFMGVNSIRFYEQFPDEKVCYRYIADINPKHQIAGKTVKSCPQSIFF